MIEEGQLHARRCLAARARAVRVRADHRRENRARLPAAERSARTSACWPKAARQPKRLLSRLPKNLEHRAGRAKWWCSPSCASRAATRRAPPSPRRALAARCQARLKYLGGRVGHEAARGALRQGARLVCACGRPAAHRPSSWPGRRARACVAEIGSGARLDRPDVRRRAAGAGLVLLVRRALAAQGEETGSRA